MAPEQMRERTKAFALAVIRLVEGLPQTAVGRTIGQQLLRSGTSVGANYRAACRARSKAEFMAKMGVVEEEADECIYWMELLSAAGITGGPDLDAIVKEANETVAIAVFSIKTARSRRAVGR